ncbi:MAG: protease modulator HflC [Chitinivibrionales bacterium]|nr:protease modulator HflC [Chitinivibrionales bacterium]
MKRIMLIILIGLALYGLRTGLYIVDETKQAVITRWGEAIGDPITKPGLHFTLPFIHKVNFFPKYLLEWDGDPGQVPTSNKTFIWIDTFARWRIVDALKFFENLRDETSAQKKLDDIIDAAARNLVTSNTLRETVRNSNREMDIDSDDISTDTAADSSEDIREISLGRAAMCQAILEQAAPKLNEFGIELVEVKFKRISYVEQVLRNVYERMIAERKQKAEKFRSEGRGASSRIAGEKEKELKRIYSEAYEDAERIKGEADNEAAGIYAQAYSKDPEFYSFLKTLDLYKVSLDSTSEAVLSTDSDWLKYLKKYSAMP